MKNTLCIISLFITSACDSNELLHSYKADWESVDYYEFSCGDDKNKLPGCKASENDMMSVGGHKGK